MKSKKGYDFGIEWDLILDNQSVKEILAKFSIYDDKISAVMVRFDSVGDIVEVWITESNAPYLLTSEYMPIDYWRNL